MFLKHNGTFWLYIVLRVLVVLLGITAVLRRDYESLLICLLVLFLFLMPSFLERKLKIELPSTLEKIILLFVFAAQILGELGAYYIRYPWWDTMLHTLNGFLCAAVGFAMVDILNENEKIKFELSPFFMALTAFSFSMTVGVLWEFFEFFMDKVFLLDMQKDTVVPLISTVMLDETKSNIPIIIEGINSVSVNGRDLGLDGYLDIGLFDTMEDLFVNFIGALVFSVIGYFGSKDDGKSHFAFHFIPRLKEEGQK